MSCGIFWISYQSTNQTLFSSGWIKKKEKNLWGEKMFLTGKWFFYFRLISAHKLSQWPFYKSRQLAIYCANVFFFLLLFFTRDALWVLFLTLNLQSEKKNYKKKPLVPISSHVRDFKKHLIYPTVNCGKMNCVFPPFWRNVTPTNTTWIRTLQVFAKIYRIQEIISGFRQRRFFFLSAMNANWTPCLYFPLRSE